MMHAPGMDIGRWQVQGVLSIQWRLALAWSFWQYSLGFQSLKDKSEFGTCNATATISCLTHVLRFIVTDTVPVPDFLESSYSLASSVVN